MGNGLGIAVFGLLLVAVVGAVVVLLARVANKRMAQQRALAEQQRQAAWHAEQQRQAVWQAEQQQRRWMAWNAEQQRRESLTARFGAASAERIMRGEFWVGQTRAELVEALGRPEDVDEKVLKTKTKEVFKYRPTGANRYALRITLDDGVVVGWEDKR